MYKFGQVVKAAEHKDSWFVSGRKYLVLDYIEAAGDLSVIMLAEDLSGPVGEPQRGPAKFFCGHVYVPEDKKAKLTAKDSDNPKTAFGLLKPPIALIPMTALVEEACTFRLGADKYGPANWREKAVPASVYINAALRHMLSWYDGQDNDLESGSSHLAHARACLAILIDAKSCDKLIDDRPPVGKGPDLCAERTLPTPT